MTSTDQRRLRAGIHARRSLNRSDEQSASVRLQIEAGTGLADRMNADVTEIYDEADLYHGRIDILIEYDLDRALREPRDLEDLIEVVEQTGRQVVSITGSLSLRNDAEITMARVMAAVANKAVRDTSRNVKRTALARAKEGKNHGGRRGYGYSPDGMTLVPHEARELVRAADELLRGTPLGSIVRELNERPMIEHLLAHRDLLAAHPEQAQRVFLLRHADGLTYTETAEQLGIREDTARRLLNKLLRDQREATPDVVTYGTVTGRPWTPSALRDTLRRPRLAGLAEHRKQIVGKGQWPAIWTVERHQAIKALLTDPARRTSTGNRAAHLLSGLALAECGAYVTSFGIKRSPYMPPRPLYRCRKDYCTAVNRDIADGYVTERVFERLSRPDALDLLIDHDRPDMDALRDEAHALRLRLDEAAALFGAGTIDARQLSVITEAARGRLAEIERAQQHTSRAPILRELIEAGTDIESVWDRMTLDRRRAVVQALMVVRVRRGEAGKRVPDLARKIEITPKE
jgi:site-specific DNA recombinase